MASVGVSSIKIRDEDGDVATVTSNRLDVNAYLSATPTIDIGDVSIKSGDGTAITDTVSGRLDVTIASASSSVECIQDTASDLLATVTPSVFGTFVTYPDFEAATSATAISDGTNGVNATITDAKEIMIQTDDANTGYIMVGSSAGTTVAGTVGSRQGLKMNGGETLVLSFSTFANIFIDASGSSQFVNVAYFK